MADPIFRLKLQKSEATLRGQKYPWLNIIDFIDRFTPVTLYPNQKLIMKLWNLETDFTDYEKKVLDKWTKTFNDDEYKEGVTGNVLEKIAILKKEGWEWFPKIISVQGRRSGKTFMVGLQLSYCLACWLYTNGFGNNFSEAGHEPSLIVMATEEKQALDNLFTDCKRAIRNNAFFAPYIVKFLTKSVSFETLEDRLKDRESDKKRVSFKARAVSSNADGVRGASIPFFAFDEAFFAKQGEGAMTGNGAMTAILNAQRENYPHSIALFPSSPRSRTGALYEMYLDSFSSSNTNTFVSQLPSWAMYENSEFPRVVKPNFKGTPRERDEAREERIKPQEYSVEVRAQFADSSFAYFQPEFVKQIFTLPAPTTKADPKIEYKIHCDPARVNDDFSLMAGHMIDGIFYADEYTVFRPGDFKDKVINYNEVEKHIQSLLVKYNPSTLTFDQFNSGSFIDRLREFCRNKSLKTRVSQETATAQTNQDTYQQLKLSINEGKVKSYKDNLNLVSKDRCLLEASLCLVEEKYENTGAKIIKPRIAGYGHLDLVDCLAWLNYQFVKEEDVKTRPNVWASWQKANQAGRIY